MGRVDDIKINSLVRKVFARHLINVESINFRTVKGKVGVYGWLEKLPLADSKLTAEGVQVLFQEVERLPGVVRVDDELENWERAGKGWVLTPLGRKAREKGRPRQRVRGRAVSSFRIKTRGEEGFRESAPRRPGAAGPGRGSTGI